MFTFKDTEYIPLNVKKLIIFDKEIELGYFLLCPHSPELFEIHTVIYPEAFGSSVEIAKQCLIWFFELNPKVQSLITKIPVNNPLAKRLVTRNKFTICGTIPNSFKTTDGLLINQDLYYFSRESL